MKFQSLAVAVLVLSLASASQAAVYNFVVDSSQSEVTVGISAGFSDSDISSVAGNLSVFLDPATAPFSSAEIGSLNLILQHGMSFNLVFASITTDPNDVTVSQVSSGGAATVTDGEFSQTGNSVILGGDVNVNGDDIDLSTMGTASIDYANASINQVGNVLTLSAPLVFVANGFIDNPLGGDPIPVTTTVTGSVVATALVPEPATFGVVMLGAGLGLLRRRRA